MNAATAMKPKLRLRWNLTPRQAIRLQERLRERTELQDRLGPIRHVAGADVAFDPRTNLAFAGVIVYQFPEMVEVERVMARGQLQFPYVPGLLSFREIPILLAAFARLKTEPDVLLVDGHGLAHPRRFGIACHLGLILDRPTIGCAKSRLVGNHRDPASHVGATALLYFQREQVGVVLRTRKGVRPIYVTQGHRISLSTALKIVQTCLDGFRIPKPTREADRYVRELRRSSTIG